MKVTVIDILEFIGTFAFAVSGIRLASAKKFDLFGAYVVGFIVAVGGGTLRDVLLGVPPFWMLNFSYLIFTAIAFGFVALFRKNLVHLHNTFFFFDSIGLGLFAVVGMNKTLMMGYPYWVAIIMGTITGIVGGVIRDTLINELPVVFRKEIYALACIIGGMAYWGCDIIGIESSITQIIGALTVILVRFIAVKYQLGLPHLKGIDE